MTTRPSSEAMKIAADADCDPRTAQKILDGGPVKSIVGRRIVGAAKKLGIKLPKRSK